MGYNFLTRDYIFKKIDFKYFSATSIFNYILNGCHNRMNITTYILLYYVTIYVHYIE